jgi:hypothetical protein
VIPAARVAGPVNRASQALIWLVVLFIVGSVEFDRQYGAGHLLHERPPAAAQ